LTLVDIIDPLHLHFLIKGHIQEFSERDYYLYYLYYHPGDSKILHCAGWLFQEGQIAQIPMMFHKFADIPIVQIEIAEIPITILSHQECQTNYPQTILLL